MTNKNLRKMSGEQAPSFSFLQDRIIYDMMKRYWWWVTERQNIFIKRFIKEEDPPWTRDRILRNKHFCNAYRELDRGTQWYLEHIGHRFDEPTEKEEKEIIFNTIMYRFFNSVDLFNIIGYQRLDEFNESELADRISELKEDDVTIFSSAYMTSGVFGESKEKHRNYLRALNRDVLQNIDELYDKIKNVEGLKELHALLSNDVTGLGNFIAYEVVIDLNYTPVVNFSENDWANVGPGAEQGLSWIFLEYEGGQEEGLQLMRILQEHQQTFFNHFELDFKKWKDKELTLRNIEHSLCEFDKYMRQLKGEGTLRNFQPKDKDLPGDTEK